MSRYVEPPQQTDSLADGAATIVEEDLHIIRRTLSGDGDAYRQIVERYQDAISSRMWRFTRDRTCHEELVQDVFVEAYFGLAGYRADAPFEFWLNKIATRIGYRFWKSRAAKTSVTIQPLSEVQIQSIATGETNELSPSEAGELVHRMLAELPPADRLVLTLISIEERTIAEAALLTGWNQTLVKVRAYRARRKLEGIWKRIESQNRGTLR